MHAVHTNHVAAMAGASGMKIPFLNDIFAIFIVSGSSVGAQTIDPELDSAPVNSGIEGFWVGVDMCGGRGFSEFLDIRRGRGILSGTFWWFGAQTGTSEVDILENEVSYVFGSRTLSVVDFDYRLEEASLVGRGRGFDYMPQIWPVPEPRFQQPLGEIKYHHSKC